MMVDLENSGNMWRKFIGLENKKQEYGGFGKRLKKIYLLGAGGNRKHCSA